MRSVRGINEFVPDSLVCIVALYALFGRLGADCASFDWRATFSCPFRKRQMELAEADVAAEDFVNQGDV